MEPDHTWKEIRRQETKKGDTIILLGLDDKDGIWGLDVFEAASDYQPPKSLADVSGGEINLGKKYFDLSTVR